MKNILKNDEPKTLVRYWIDELGFNPEVLKTAAITYRCGINYVIDVYTVLPFTDEDMRDGYTLHHEEMIVDACTVVPVDKIHTEVIYAIEFGFPEDGKVMLMEENDETYLKLAPHNPPVNKATLIESWFTGPSYMHQVVADMLEAEEDEGMLNYTIKAAYFDFIGRKYNYGDEKGPRWYMLKQPISGDDINLNEIMFDDIIHRKTYTDQVKPQILQLINEHKLPLGNYGIWVWHESIVNPGWLRFQVEIFKYGDEVHVNWTRDVEDYKKDTILNEVFKRNKLMIRHRDAHSLIFGIEPGDDVVYYGAAVNGGNNVIYEHQFKEWISKTRIHIDKLSKWLDNDRVTLINEINDGTLQAK